MTKRKNAFTLAEMLITLAVIGIVAALTIPGLVKNHNEKAWATAKDVFSKKLEVAMKAMNTDGTLTGYSTTASFVNALKKNIKITKVCTDDVTKCFSKEVIWNAAKAPVLISEDAITYEKSQGQDWAETVGVQFSNGVTALIAYNKNCTSDPFNNQFVASASCLGIIYDVSANKKPNENGKDIATNANVLKLRDLRGCVYTFPGKEEDICISKILSPDDGYNYMSKSTCENSSGANAGHLTQAAGKAAELGIKQCSYMQDYWAGAVAACGGVDKMLNSEQLAYLAQDLYNLEEPIGTESNVSNLTFDTIKVANFSTGYGFYVWTGEETSYEKANYRYFSQGQTNYNFTGNGSKGRHSKMLAVCVGD